jgi:hypothetical protein
VLVDDVNDVPGAIELLIKDKYDYRARCHRFNREYLQFDRWWGKFCDLLLERTGFAIAPPRGVSRY